MMQSHRYARVLTGFVSLAQHPTALLGERDMRLLIDLERERTDRGGGPFAIVELALRDDLASADRPSRRLSSPKARQRALIRALLPRMRRRLRRIDVIGRLNGHLAVLMPNTGEAGARKAAADIVAGSEAALPVHWSVSVYPAPDRRNAKPSAVVPDPMAGTAGLASAQAGRSSAMRSVSAAHCAGDPVVSKPHVSAAALLPQGCAWKRALDLSGALAMLLGVAPILAGCALYLQLRDPGPVLFHQRRIGWQGRSFLMLKLRTMRVDADETQHQRHLQSLIRSNERMTKLDSGGDPRIIPGAELMRKLGIDELPQLINVLRGEMSLVGPRPCLAYEAHALEPWQRARFKVRPGLTGAWQVNGKNRTTFRRMLELDVGYTHAPRLWSDIVILLRTLPAVIAYARGSGEGASPR